MMKRTEMVETLAERIDRITQDHPVRVAIDGVDASGKTTLANELVVPLERRHRNVIRASIDGFHNPRAVRYRLGEDSPEGYYRDSFDLGALRALLLDPLGPQGDRSFRRKKYDLIRDEEVAVPLEQADPRSILLFDGVFLMRPELISCWDYRIFVHADFDVTVPRAMSRDMSLHGDAEDVKDRYMKRFVPGQRLYLAEADPRGKGSVVVMNNYIDDPKLVFPGGA